MGKEDEHLGWPRSERLAQPGRRRIFAGLLGLLLIGSVCLFLAQEPPQPVYHGKPLTVWLQTYTSSANGRPDWKEADEALRQIGTNAIPVLLQLLRARDSALKLRLIALAQKQPLIRIHRVPATVRNLQASRAFIVLGDSAKAAVPALVKMLDENLSADSLSAVEDALSWIGPAAEPAVPVLLHNTTNSNPNARANALWTLGEIHAEPQLCVPALMKGLTDSNNLARLSAAHALGRFGTNAQPAIPALTALAELPLIVQGSDFTAIQVHLEARNALKKIRAALNTPTTEPFPFFEGPGAWKISEQ